MFCKNCGNKIKDEEKFCSSCGVGAGQVGKSDLPADSVKKEVRAIIKCGNCAYIGPGEPARSIAGIILAWLCVLFAPIITIIYFAATHKYRCPKCKSTFLGVKNREGNFVGQSGAGRVVIVIVFLLVGIAVMGILSAIVLASLNSARTKAKDAQIQAGLSSMRAAAEIYYSKNLESYSVASDCNHGMFASSDLSDLVSNVQEKGTNVKCYANGDSWAASSVLTNSTGDSWCVDSTGKSQNGTATESNLKAFCSKDISSNSSVEDSSDSMTNEEYVKQVVVEAKKQLTLPKKTDENTTLTDIVAEQSTLRYKYTLQGLDLSDYTDSSFNKKMKPLLADDLCKNDSLTGFLNRGIDVKYSYLDLETYKSYLITFTKGDCL